VSLQPVSRIFVVDDEHIIGLTALLQMNGYSAIFYTCPLEALTSARLKAPGLLISDVATPGFRD
jgi:FixJ family two-component response regulator